MKKIIPWIALTALFIAGISGSYFLSSIFKADGSTAWETEIDQTARLLSGTIVGWLKESYAPISGLAVLFENSNHVSKVEFFNAAKALQARTTTLFIDSYAIARSNNKDNSWFIEYANKPFDTFSSDQSFEFRTELQAAIEIANANPKQIILGPPLTTKGSANYSPVTLAIKDQKGWLVVIGLLNQYAIVQELVDRHQPLGIHLQFQGRFVEANGLGKFKNISGKPPFPFLYKTTTKAISASANLKFTWFADDLFSGGPEEGLADLILIGGILGSLLTTLFFSLIIRQNILIRLKVKYATEELIENKQRLNLALAASSIGFWESDIINNKTIWDDVHHKIYGTNPDNGVPDHQTFLKLIHPDDVEQLEIRVNKTLESGEDYYNEFRIITPDGKIKTIVSRAQVIRDKNSKPIRLIGTEIDITDRKLAEEELKRSQLQLKALFEALPVGVVMIGPKGEIREANRISENILGISADEHKMRDLQSEKWQILRPDGSEMPVEEYPASRALSGEGIIKNVEMKVKRPDGSLVLINTGAAPVEESAGGGVAVAFEDITQRKIFDENLRKLSQAVEQSPVSIVITDTNGIIEYVNPRFCEITGYSEAEAIGQNPRILKYESEPQDIYKDLWQTIKTGKEWRGQFCNKKKNGEIYWESATISPITADDGTIKSFLAVKEDITDRKRIESELAETNILMKALIDSPNDIVIFSLDINYCYTAFNKAHFREMKKVYGSEIKLGDSMLKAITIPELKPIIKKTLDRVLSGDTFSEIQQQPDTNIFYEFNWGSVRNENKQIIGLSAFISDISEQKNLEKELKTRVEDQEEAQSAMLNMMEDLDEEKGKAEEATMAKSDFLANMSHEIRTPMNAIMGMTHLALQTELTAKQTDYLNKVHNSATSLLNIINDILDFSKIEAGKLDMESTDFSLDAVMDNITMLISVKSQEKELEFLFQLQPDVPRFLVGDPLRLGQILINLANNAVKFTAKGEVVITAKAIKHDNDTITIQFSVKDTGIGMTEQQIGKLFKSFSQADTSTTRKFGGTGLGLTISKKLVEMMNGKIWVESVPQEGSRFIFEADFGVQKNQKQKNFVPSPDLRRMKVLVVDDNPSARTIFRSVLESFTFNVSEVDSGSAALEKIKAADDPFKLIIMDWKMPGMDGIITAEKIKAAKIEDQPKIILATSYGREEIMRQAERVKLDGFLIKPINPSVMFNAVLNAFGKEADIDSSENTSGAIDTESLKPIRGAKLLLVEDNEINQQVAQEILENAGFYVELAENGKIGVEKVKNHQYDLVLMDIQMPVMDGYKASETIRKHEQFKNLPIVAMTANAMVGDREKAMEVGMNDHVAKPIDPQQLFATLVKWIKPGKREIPKDLQEAKKATNQKIELPKSIAGIDIDTGLFRVGGNKKLYQDLLIKFHRDNQDITEQITNALDKNDTELAQRLAHTVKGVSGNIGATDIQKAAGVVELNIKDGQQEDIKILILTLKEKLTISMAELKNLTATMKKETSSNENKSDGTTDQLKAYLAELEPLLKKRKPKPCKLILIKINEFEWSDEYKNLIRDLMGFIAKYKFKDAIKKQETLMKLLLL